MINFKTSPFLIAAAILSKGTRSLDPPVQTYFIPFPEYQLFTETFEATNNDRVDWPIQSIVSIAIAADNTIIYYDHWEDGYELDVTNPTQSSTEIWGDGTLSNGGKPGATTDAEDILKGGTSYVLNSTVPENYEINKPMPYKVDGSDRVQASLPIAMTRSAFPSSPGALMAGAVEIFNTASWGKYFVAPIGINTGSNTLGHESVVTYVMAGENKTEVKRNGNFIATLNAGQSFVVRDTALGDNFTSDKTIQVDILAGDIGSTYELRWIAQIPREKWGNAYLSPVGENTGPTAYVLYNPNPTDLVVQYDGAGFCPMPPCEISVPSEDDLVVVVDSDIELSGDYSGIKFYANDDFYVFAEVDADGMGNIFDWGFPLIPIDQTTSQVLVGNGRGCTSNSCDLEDENKGLARSPLWVTCEDDCDITLYLNGIGNPPHERLFGVPKLSSTRFYPDNNNSTDYSGAIISARKAGTEYPINIAVAWGQDPRRSFSGDADGLDLGTAIVPLANLFVSKSVVNITNPDGSLDSDNIVDQVGDTINYKVTLSNVGFGDLEIDQVFDSLLNRSLDEPTEKGDNNNELSPGETWVYCFSYVVNANDITQDAIKNTVTVSTSEFPPVSDDEIVGVKLVSISGHILEDTDENDTGDIGISGVMIKLHDATTRNELMSTITDKNGYYQFAGLEAGNYTIMESQPSGYVAVRDVGDPYESPIRVNQLDVSLNGESDIVMQNFIEERASSAPSKAPSNRPSSRPSLRPSVVPSVFPSRFPSFNPTSDPTSRPTSSPTSSPTSAPTSSPTTQPTRVVSELPSLFPTSKPSSIPSSLPSDFPSFVPTLKPSTSLSNSPSGFPSVAPSFGPSFTSIDPTFQPSSIPPLPTTILTTCDNSGNLLALKDRNLVDLARRGQIGDCCRVTFSSFLSPCDFYVNACPDPTTGDTGWPRNIDDQGVGCSYTPDLERFIQAQCAYTGPGYENLSRQERESMCTSSGISNIASQLRHAIRNDACCITPTTSPTTLPTSLPTFLPTSSPTSAPTSAPTPVLSIEPSSKSPQTGGRFDELPTYSFAPSDIPSLKPSFETTSPINIRTSPPIFTEEFCEVVLDQSCSLCAPYRSPDYCPSNQSFPSLIKNRTQDYRTDISKVIDSGYWFPYLEDKVAGYRVTVENGFPAPRIFCCETDFKGVQDCLSRRIPPTFDGVVIKATTMHSSQGVYVLLNDNQPDNSFLELLTGLRMTYADVLSSLDFVQATKVIVEEFIGSELPMEYKFHVTGGKVQAVDVVANRGADCQCYAVVDTDWTRLDQFGCFEPVNDGFREDEDNDKCTEIDFDAGKQNIGPVKKDMYLCDDVPRVDDCLWEEMQSIALRLGESIGVSIRVDMFVANGQIYVQEYATNHMNGLRHCAAKRDENGCIDSCFLGRAWEEAGGLYGGVPTAVPGYLENYHLKSASGMCDLLDGVATITTYVQKSCRRQ